MLDLKQYFDENDIFNKKNGIYLTEYEPGRAVFETEVTEDLMSRVVQPHAHPAVLYSMAESASAAAVLSYGYSCLGVEGNITYLGVATQGRLRAEAKCKDCHEDGIVHVRVRIYDEADNIIAKASFTSQYDGKMMEQASCEKVSTEWPGMHKKL